MGPYIVRLIFLLSLSIFVKCHQQFDNYIDKWNMLVKIQGQFDKNHTLFENAKCNPCDYLIIVYRDYIQLLIDDPEEGRSDQVKAFEFTIQQNHHNQTFWDFDQERIKIQTKKDSNIKQSIQRFTRNGIQWKYQFTLPIEGIILKGQTKPFYQYLIPGITLLFALLIFMYLPLRSKARAELFLEIPRRTPLLSLLILSQVQHIIFLQIITIAIKYLLYEESFFMKSIWYCVFMIPFGFTILHILIIYDSIRVSYIKTVQKLTKSARIIDIGSIMTFLIGLYVVTLILLLVNKDIWIFCYFSVYFVWQLGWSLINKAYPYLSLNIYFVVLIGYQMFLSNFSPLFWFNQLTLYEIAMFWGCFIAFYLLASLIQKFCIGIELVSQVIFQESKQMQMGQPWSSKQTELNFGPNEQT